MGDAVEMSRLHSSTSTGDILEINRKAVNLYVYLAKMPHPEFSAYLNRSTIFDGSVNSVERTSEIINGL